MPTRKKPTSQQTSDSSLKLTEAKARVANLTVAGLRDDLTPDQREGVRNLEQSARAEVKLRRLAFEQEQAEAAGLPIVPQPGTPPLQNS